jgi:hypothetical protein
MSAVIQGLRDQINGCNPVNMCFLNLNEFNKMVGPFNQDENQIEFLKLLIKTNQFYLDILKERVNFDKIKSKYDPDCQSRNSLTLLVVGLNKIEDRYNSFTKRRFEIGMELGGGSYTAAQKAICQANLKEIVERMEFFDEVTEFTGEVKKHRDTLRGECFIL